MGSHTHARYTDTEAIAAAKTVKLDDFATPDDNTDLDAAAVRHGLLPKLSWIPSNFLDGQGGWSNIPYRSSSLPANPSTGQLHLLNLTGRNVLIEYDGSSWQPLVSLGSMTMYVDKTDGTDDETHGTGVDGLAFATIQYAIDQIPGLVGGNVVIYVNGEDYAETVTIQGKVLTGNYTITLQGTLSSDQSGTSSANGVQGTGATHGSVTDTGNMAGHANKLMYLDADGDYRIIDSVTADVATIVGYFTSQPLSGENYIIYSWGTVIDRLIIKAGQVGVVLNDIKVEGDASNYPVEVEFGGYLTAHRCYLTNATTQTVWCEGACFLHQSLAEVTFGTGCILPILTGEVMLDGIKILATHDGARGLWALYGGVAYLGRYSWQQPCVIDGVAGADKAVGGVVVSGNAFVSCEALYNKIRNCDNGIQANTGGQVINTVNNQYSGNTADETATAASYGYID